MCCYCGDFNAKMGCLNDFVHDTPCNNVTNDNCLIEPRNLRHVTVNWYGGSLAELCCGNDLVILNGRTIGDFLGQFTCNTYNGASVVDYAVASCNNLPLIKYFSVSVMREFSDHCFLFCLES